MRGVVDGDEDLTIHRHLPFRARRVCQPRNRLSSNHETGNATTRLPDAYRIHGAGVARAQQSFALHGLGRDEHRHGVLVQFETLGRFLHAVPEPDALVAVDHDAQPVHRALAETHIPSTPSSVRAVSMTAGVISAMPRSLA